ncbi:MAG: hypothetical protein D6733_03105 [Methanobacteriota archaeon]|nr:MAG: hypothetical protein D6733_03105 [Euryarchaeota archaeon]
MWNMEKRLRKALAVWAAVSIFSFLAGGVYTEMIKEGLGFSPANILFALIGAALIGIPFFIAAYLVQLILSRS